ncbi:type I phosphomannose isomerase catalytic subunit [Candidatus Clostridium stratigraminis]|uniref:Phosphohexomutase n=1 Tax=Candidatus Clostridium stratigraminis TaxID=3381661 RepID=A0ABW8T4H7_9CLOT
MGPLKFENIYFNKIWGGRDFSNFRNNLPQGDIGESWDVACHPHGTSIISNGEFKGMKLSELIDIKEEEIIGKEVSKSWFPLLVKLINAKEKLSVQVHPSDDYARIAEGELGKTEAWYIVEASKDANIVLGTRHCTKEQFKKAMETGKFDEYMNVIPVKKGEVYFVKSGLIHAIGGGIIIAEIQQNSDTTYRVYDYNRGRELHLDKAMDVINLNLFGEKSRGLEVKYDGYSKIYYCLCENFSLELYDITSSVKEVSDPERFYIYLVVEGNGEILFKGGKETIDLGESILIPASLGDYEIYGNLKILKTYVPDVEKVKSEILRNVIF